MDKFALICYSPSLSEFVVVKLEVTTFWAIFQLFAHFASELLLPLISRPGVCAPVLVC